MAGIAMIALTCCCATLFWVFQGTGSAFIPPSRSADLLPLDSLPVLASVGWGACNKHDRNQKFWRTIGRTLSMNATRRADGFIWLGDAIYADDRTSPRESSRAGFVSTMRTKFDTFRTSEHYAEFRQGLLREPVGVWDDHDMGTNDADRHYALKHEAKQLYLDFLNVPPHAPQRRRSGVYSLIAIPFQNGSSALAQQYDFAVCTVLLDGRFNRDSAGVSGGDMLGEEQWMWLAAILADPSADIGAPRKRNGLDLFSRCAVTAFGSGVQILSDEKPTENWGMFPASRERLLRTLAYANARRFVLLSGDVHYADHLTVAHPSLFATQDVVEMTSSGLTHSLADVGMSQERFDLLNWTPRRVGSFVGRTFGSIAVTESVAVVSVHDIVSGRTVLQHSVQLLGIEGSLRPARAEVMFGFDVLDAPSKRIFTLLDAMPFAIPFRTKHIIADVAASLWHGFCGFAFHRTS